MSYPTANELTQEMLLMKLTPAAIGHMTSELFRADEQTLNTIPRHAYHHYFDEVSMAFLNWMGHGQSAAIDELLRNLSYIVFNAPDMHRLPDLTVKQHIGLHLRALSAHMTLSQKAQSTISYSVLLTGVRNQTPRTIIRVLYDSMQAYPGLSRGALPPNEIHKQVLTFCQGGKTSLQNVLHHLTQLTGKGLLIQETSGKRVLYQLSGRGVFEARYHFEQEANNESVQPEARMVTTSTDTPTPTQPENKQFQPTDGAQMVRPPRLKPELV